MQLLILIIGVPSASLGIHHGVIFIHILASIASRALISRARMQRRYTFVVYENFVVLVLVGEELSWVESGVELECGVVAVVWRQTYSKRIIVFELVAPLLS